MHTVFSPTGHLSHLTISDRENMHDARYGLDAAQRAEIQKCYDLAHTGLASARKHIRKQVERYPDNPILLNYLGTWHDVRGEHDEAIALVEKAVERFPDYLFANVSMATIRISQDRHEEALRYLGPGLRIEERFPGRAEFHINEVEAYEKACLRYLLGMHDMEQARTRMEAFRPICTDTEWLDRMDAALTMGLVAARSAAEEVELARMPSMEFATQPVSPHADRELVLHHPELRELFQWSMDIPPERVQAILALPRETLVRDLAAIVQHSIDRFHHYKENEEELWFDQLSFVQHTLFLLGELPGEDSLEAVLVALSQSEEYMDLYLGDGLTELVWEPVTKLAEGNFGRLTAFMQVSRLHAFSKVVVSEGMGQLVHHRPDLLPAVEQWYAGLLAFYINASPEEEVMDAVQLGLMVGDILDLGLASLLPAIEALYARDIVPSNMNGPIEKVREEFARHDPGRFKREKLGIVERYAQLAELERRWMENADDGDDGADDVLDLPPVQIPIVRATPKVGRNDPCPCGSGKKHKKCCAEKASVPLQAFQALR